MPGFESWLRLLMRASQNQVPLAGLAAEVMKDEDSSSVHRQSDDTSRETGVLSAADRHAHTATTSHPGQNTRSVPAGQKEQPLPVNRRVRSLHLMNPC